MPDGVFNFITGSGGTAGQELVDNADVDGIVFTGSKDVGMHLIRDNATRPFPRPLIIEMGGKNPALVMPSADLDKASDGVMRSAFGAQGQKCSACSRVYVAGAGARRVRPPAGREDEEDQDRQSAQPRRLSRPGDQRGRRQDVRARDRAGEGRRREDSDRRPAAHGRRVRARLLRRADHHRRPARQPSAVFRRAVRADHARRRCHDARRGDRPRQQHSSTA